MLLLPGLLAAVFFVANLFFWSYHFGRFSGLPAAPADSAEERIDSNYLHVLDLEMGKEKPTAPTPKQRVSFGGQVFDTLLYRGFSATLFSLSLVVYAYLGNKTIQIFCQPVLWAACVLAVLTFCWALQPLFYPKKSIANLLLAPVMGVGLLFCLYCLWFLGWYALAMLPIVAVAGGGLVLGFSAPNSTVFALTNSFCGLLAAPALPLILLFKSLVYFVRVHLIYKLLFLLGMAAAVGGTVYQVQRIRAVTSQDTYTAVLEIALRNMFSATGESNDPQTEIPDAYYWELALGAHIKYHLSFSPYDGWRPPLHDPFLVIADWFGLSSESVFPNVTEDITAQRIELYRMVFQQIPTADCTCAWQYSQDYHNFFRNVEEANNGFPF